MRETVKDVVRASHWIEIAEYLGQPTQRARETFLLYLRLLGPLGYHMVQDGEAPPAARVAPAELTVDRAQLFDAVEEAIMQVTERRLAGDRVSDQAEVREIVAAVGRVIDKASAGA